ncbi:hypothetical protein N0V95_005840 [Ascochyta clinopodiicola]|nr:hypothetical protein N0V95_005840 [Ascochyta clinopodiicola]
MPWHVLANGPAAADKTVMLEYMSRTILGNMWLSIKNRHWAVTGTMLGNLVFLLMIVFATGLFALESTLVSHQGVQFTRNRFNGSAYNSSAVGASPALLSFAIQGQNLSYPQGTTGDTIVPLFKPVMTQPEDSNYEALVDGLNVSIDCKVLDLNNATKTYLPWWSLRAPYFLSNISTPDCELLNVPIGSGSDGMVRSENKTQTYFANIAQYVCNSGMDYSTPESRGQVVYSQTAPDLTAYRDNLNKTLDSRIFISVIDFRFPPSTQSEKPGIWIHNLTTMLCKPTYSINNYRVEYFQNSTSSVIELVNRTSDALSDLYSGDISRGVYNVFNDYENLYLGMGGSDFVLSEAVPPFFQIIENLQGGGKSNFTLKNLLEPNVLKSSVESLVAETAVQLLHTNIMTDMSYSGNDVFQGISTYSEKRLHTKAISTGFLCACFALMATLCLALIFLVPGKVNAKGAIGSALIILDTMNANPNLVEDFRDQPSGLTLQSRKYQSYGSSGSNAIAIDSVAAENSIAKSTTSVSKAQKSRVSHWWYPASARFWFTAVVVALALAIIGILEGIQHISDRGMGFVEVRSLNIGTTVLAQNVPAAIALCISLMFGSVEQVVAAAIPFATLRRGNAIAPRTLALDYLTKSGPQIFVSSVINRHLALSVILATTFVASFLSIVIPGLYSHVAISAVGNATVLRHDKFDPSGSDVSFDDKYAATMLNLLTYYGVEYSNWVFDDLALPQLIVPSLAPELHENVDSSSAKLSLRTEATRAKLRCEPVSTRTRWVVKPKHIGTMYRGASDWASISSSIELPWTLCSNPPKNASANATVTWVQEFLTSNSTLPGDSIYVGKADILKWDEALHKQYKGILNIGGDGTKESRTGAGLNPIPITLADWGCPSLAFTLGTMDFQADPRNTTRILTDPIDEHSTWIWNNMVVKADVATLICSQNVQVVETDITLDYPSLSISSTTPPRPDENTVKWLRNTTAAKDGTTFQFAPNSMLLSLNNPNGSSSDPWQLIDDIDRFTQALAYVAQKEDNFTLQDIVGVNNIANLQKAAQKLYGRYMAQAFSSNMRVDVNKETPNITLTDTPWKPLSSNSTSNPKLRSTTPSSHPNTLEHRDAPLPTIPATLTQTGAGAHTRMVQNKGPKIALQVMLGFMAAGAILTKLLLRTKQLLPHEPYSIAGRAILVANGNILQERGSGKDNGGKEQRYRLGWWKDEQGKERYGICVEE